ncbi:hypothetical protein F5887DRAFT_877323 [Amanita rubescens]|nr:hypothetical protein F5887DRAFT_877323 [Amanita rubescens]
MSEHTRSQSVGFDAFSDYQKAFASFDSFINPTTDPVAPHPEIFESEVDSSLAGYEGPLDFLNNPVFSIPLNDSFFNNSAPSAFTSSSDSAYDTVSTRSESFYNYPNSPYPPSSFSYVDMDLGQVHPRGGSEYACSATLSTMDNAADPTSFGPLPPTPPRSPINSANKVFDRSYANSTCFSDYSGASGPVASEYFSSLEFGASGMSHPTVSPLNVSTRTLGPTTTAMEEHKMDPRRKHKCSKCTRAFARAFNLKTHMATHDPNRLKPHICPHRNCARSFSRKHDLGRHLTSIHRDEAVSAKRAIGVAKADRSWCQTCGKGGFAGRSSGCSCHDIK